MQITKLYVEEGIPELSVVESSFNNFIDFYNNEIYKISKDNYLNPEMFSFIRENYPEYNFNHSFELSTEFGNDNELSYVTIKQHCKIYHRPYCKDEDNFTKFTVEIKIKKTNQ